MLFYGELAVIKVKTQMLFAFGVSHHMYVRATFEPLCEKTGFVHMRKQRRRSAALNLEADQPLFSLHRKYDSSIF